MNKEMLLAMNLKCAEFVTESDPRFVGVYRAEDVLENYTPDTILHSGPPIEYEDMCALHQMGMRNGAILEGFAKDEKEADALLRSGKIKVDSAMNYNTVGSGVGIITRSVPLLVVEDFRTGRRAGVFPAEGKFGGGFCGWGVYSEEIRDNLFYMRDTLFSDLTRVLEAEGGFPLMDIIRDGILMGDENHSSQRAVDALFIRRILPLALKCKNANELLAYFASTNRFFHNFGQAASRAALLGCEGTPFASMVTAAGGNGVTYGIKIASLGNKWFTAPSPMIRGKYMVEGAREENQLPWIGDSSIVECAGLGGIISAASPEVASWRGDTLEDAIRTTRDMEKICIRLNTHIRIPALNFDHSPVGIDPFKVIKNDILPVIDGGMIGKDGGWMGAGCARIPMECFTKAALAYMAKFGQYSE